MRYILLAILMGLIVSAPVQAASVNDPGLLPDNPLYIFKKISENIGTFLTFDKTKKAKRLSSLADKRIAEAQKLFQKGATTRATETMTDYQRHMERATSYVKKFEKDAPDATTAAETISTAAIRQQQLLTELIDTVPETATATIGQAITVSSQGFSTSIEVLPSDIRESLLKSVEKETTRIQETITDMQESDTSLPTFSTINIHAIENRAIEMPAPPDIGISDRSTTQLPVVPSESPNTATAPSGTSGSQTSNTNTGRTFEFKIIEPRIAQ